jgi:hypothetical protein
MAAFWAVFTFGGSGPDITAHGSLDLKQEIQIQPHPHPPGIMWFCRLWVFGVFHAQEGLFTVHRVCICHVSCSVVFCTFSEFLV